MTRTLRCVIGGVCNGIFYRRDRDREIPSCKGARRDSGILKILLAISVVSANCRDALAHAEQYRRRAAHKIDAAD